MMQQRPKELTKGTMDFTMQTLCVFFFTLFFPLQLTCEQFDSNVLLPNENVQITSEISAFENLAATKPIQGSILITHDAKNLIDSNSFKIGDTPLKVQFVQTVPMSSSQSTLEVSIYQFQLPGMKAGTHTLQPISVKVGSKTYAAPPLTIQVY